MASVYRGIDVVFHGTQGSLEYDFIIGPGADASRICIGIEGAQRWNIDAKGDLVIRTQGGSFFHRRPRAFQLVDGKQVEVSSSYRIVDKGVLGFKLAAFDRSVPLTVDPVLSFSTYLGGAGSDSARAIAVDGFNGIYVTGFTTSTDFPVKNAVQGNMKGGGDVFITKINGLTHTIEYSTYLGSSQTDFGHSIAVDSAGSAYVTGVTAGSDFPLLNPIRSTHQNGEAFVTKLSPAGTIVYSTFLGGEGVEEAKSIYVDGTGSVYVAGSTFSAMFPAVNAYQTPNRGGWDGFVAKLNPAGSGLEFSSVLGGSLAEMVNGVTLDSSGNILLTGTSQSSDMPLINPVQVAPPPPHTATVAFIAKMNPSATALIYATHLGASAATVGYNGSTFGRAITTDSSGNAYVVGDTDSYSFHVVNSFKSHPDRTDCFITRFSPAGNIAFSTLIGSGSGELCTSVAVDSSGRIWVAGSNDGQDFPLIDPIQATRTPSNTNILFQLSNDGAAILFSTFLGTQQGQINPGGMAIDSNANVYLAGEVWGQGFPTVQSLQSFSGSQDAFISRISGQTACSYTVSSPIPANIPPAGGSGTVMVITQPGCRWNAVSQSLVTITGSTVPGYGTWYDGTGSGPVSYSLSYAGGPNRSFDIVVAGRKVTVNQQGFGCNPSMTPPTNTLPAAGGRGSFTISDVSDCTYQAVSNASWITLQPPTSGTSGGIVNYSAGPNTSCAQRQGTITAAGLTHTVAQPALPCLPTLITNACFLPDGFQGTSYSGSVTAAGGEPPYTWTVATGAPPPGVSLLTSGVVQGVPNAIGSFNFTAKVRDSAGSEAQTPCSIKINQNKPAKIGTYNAGQWKLDVNANGTFDSGADRTAFLGWPGAIQFTGDWNGDGKTKVGVYSNGYWFLDYDGNGIWDNGVNDKLVAWGWPGVTPLVGDWNGNGRTKIGVFSNGFWFLDYNGDFAWDGGVADKQIGWGWAGVIPFVGDWNGDGKTKIGVYSNGFWFLDYNGNYAWEPGGPDKQIGWGWAGITPIVGDWNGDGRAKIGVYAGGYWYLDYDGNYAWTYPISDRIWQIGWTGTMPVIGDWNGDGKAKAGAFINGYWYLDYDGSGLFDGVGIDRVYAFGAASDTPVVGRW